VPTTLYEENAMYAVIVGGGKVGSSLANLLAEQGHTVTIVEFDRDKCALLTEPGSAVTVQCGDGDEPDVLEAANVARADVLVAATGHDEDNLVVCLLGKHEYRVPLTMARVNNPKNEWLFTERFGVDVLISNTAIMAEVLKNVSLGDIVTLLRLKSENMAIDEVVLTEDGPAVGRRIADLGLPANTQVMAIISDGQVVAPRGDTVLRAGDEVLLLANCEDRPALRRVFGGRGSGSAGPAV
jgi:trk system potassium uptake protein TrkA